jgi:hypothetical protein
LIKPADVAESGMSVSPPFCLFFALFFDNAGVYHIHGIDTKQNIKLFGQYFALWPFGGNIAHGASGRRAFGIFLLKKLVKF